MLQSEAGYIDARPPPPIRRNLLATHGRTIHRCQKLEVLAPHPARLPASQKRFECVSKNGTQPKLHWLSVGAVGQETLIQGDATWRSISTTRSCRHATARPRRN